jgi:hypothetical protein
MKKDDPTYVPGSCNRKAQPKTQVAPDLECKCCSKLKRELIEIQEELSSATLIIELLQTEGSTKERVGYGTIELRNSIQRKIRN